MARKLEIERKYLVLRDRLPPLPPGARLVQGYLALKPTVRVRTEEGVEGPARGWLTIKGAGLVGRDEFEYEIPADEARAMFDLCTGSLIAKTRHVLPVDGHPDLVWEIDLFEGANAPLAVAEIELPEAGLDVPAPEWLGLDVTEEPAYKNAALALYPYSTWGDLPPAA